MTLFPHRAPCPDLPEDVGIASILSKEYDLLRNLDYRLLTELYCNVIIVERGDSVGAW